MRLILSRKGFDSASGGRPSPILPDGTMLSIPIPEPVETGIPYAELRTPSGSTYAEVMTQLGMRIPIRQAHPDPDVDEGTRPRLPGWRGLLGQADAAQTHLRNMNIGSGDLFLLFGLFRHTKLTNGLLKFTGDRIHAVWGYFAVADRWDTPHCAKAPTWASAHPHVAHPERYANNSVYIAEAQLPLATDLPGFGTLRWSEKLRLTALGRTSSIWQLPEFFWRPDTLPTLTYHTKPARWSRDSGAVTLKSVGRGQEFVIDADVSLQNWALGLIRNGLA